MKYIGGAVSVIVGVLLLVGIAIGAWQLGWFVEEKNVNKRTEINNDSTARQSALNETILDNYRDVRNIDVQMTEAVNEAQRAPLEAQRVAILNQACDSYAQSTGKFSLPDDVVAYLETECY